MCKCMCKCNCNNRIPRCNISCWQLQPSQAIVFVTLEYLSLSNCWPGYGMADICKMRLCIFTLVCLAIHPVFFIIFLLLPSFIEIEIFDFFPLVLAVVENIFYWNILLHFAFAKCMSVGNEQKDKMTDGHLHWRGTYRFCLPSSFWIAVVNMQCLHWKIMIATRLSDSYFVCEFSSLLQQLFAILSAVQKLWKVEYFHFEEKNLRSLVIFL